MKKEFSIDGETPARLVTNIDGMRIDLYFDGVHQATLDSADERKRGWSTQLEDGSTLEYRWVRRVGWPEPVILRDGRHIASSPSHPHKILKSHSNTMLFLSALWIVPALLYEQGVDWIELGFGIFFLIAAVLYRKQRRLGVVFAVIPTFLGLDIQLFVLFTNTGSLREVLFRSFALLFLGRFAVRAYFAAAEAQKMPLVTAA